VAPAYDGPGAPTALLAANAAWEILALVAIANNPPDPARDGHDPNTPD